MLTRRALAELFHFLIGERALTGTTRSLLKRLDASVSEGAGILRQRHRAAQHRSENDQAERNNSKHRYQRTNWQRVESIPRSWDSKTHRSNPGLSQTHSQIPRDMAN